MKRRRELEPEGTMSMRRECDRLSKARYGALNSEYYKHRFVNTGRGLHYSASNGDGSVKVGVLINVHKDPSPCYTLYGFKEIARHTLKRRGDV